METQTQNCDAKTATANGFGTTSLPEPAIFRKEGEYWAIGYAGKFFRLRDTKGLAYLHHLLRNPGVEIHALDIGRREDVGVGVLGRSSTALGLDREDLRKAALRVGGLGDAGELIDEQAKANYRRRLRELRAALEDAKHLHRIERATAIELEMDALVGELSRAVGLGGRIRHASSASERARQAVTRAIRAAVEKIGRHHAQLGRILSRCVQTGTFCSYDPGRDVAIAWQFEGDSLNPVQPIGGDRQWSNVEQRDSDAADAQTTPAAHFSCNRPNHFAGREVELGELRELMASARAGHGSLIMIGGGLGVGKTRLAMESAAQARERGFSCFVGRCYERDEPYPFLPFAEMLEACLTQTADLTEFRRKLGGHAAELAQIAPRLRWVFPDIPMPTQLLPQQVRRHLLQSCVEYLIQAACGAPLMVIIDDLHWADESSLAMLTYLANHVAQLPMIVIGLYRDVDVDANPLLVRTLDELIRAGVRPKRVTGLSRDEVGAMLRGLGGLPLPDDLTRIIYEQTQGNPFFVEELFHSLADGDKIFHSGGGFRPASEIGQIAVPEQLRLVLGRRLGRLSEETRRILIAVAVIGPSFSFSLLKTLMDQVALDDLVAAVEEAQRLGLIYSTAHGSEAQLTFSNELMRQTLLADVSTPRLQRLHLNAAYALKKVHTRPLKETAARIAHHLAQAGSLAEPLLVTRYLAIASGFEPVPAGFRGANLVIPKRQHSQMRFSPSSQVLQASQVLPVSQVLQEPESPKILHNTDGSPGALPRSAEPAH